MPLAFDEPHQSTVTILPSSLERVPGPPRQGFKAFAPVIRQIVAFSEGFLRSNPVAQRRAVVVSIARRNAAVPFAFDELRQAAVTLLPLRLICVPSPTGQGLKASCPRFEQRPLLSGRSLSLVGDPSTKLV